MKREIRLNVLRNWRFVLEWATFVSIILYDRDVCAYGKRPAHARSSRGC